MSKKNRKQWRASVQREKQQQPAQPDVESKPQPLTAVEAALVPRRPAPELMAQIKSGVPASVALNSGPKPHLLKGMARREWIDARALEMYERELGMDINVHVQCCTLTAEAFNSQMNAAKGVDEDKAWGPDVNPYEARMTGSLLARLMREKRTWLRDCRQRIEQALAEDLAAEEEANSPASNGREPGVDASATETDSATHESVAQMDAEDGDSSQARGQSPAFETGVAVREEEPALTATS